MQIKEGVGKFKKVMYNSKTSLWFLIVFFFTLSLEFKLLSFEKPPKKVGNFFVL